MLIGSSTHRWLIMVLLVISSASALAVQTQTAFKQISWQPRSLHTGSACLFTVVLDNQPTAVTGTWLGKDLTFFKATRPHTWYALAGVDLETKPGTYDLAIRATLPGSNIAASRSISIAPSHYKTVALTVPSSFTNPSLQMQSEIAADKDFKSKVFAERTEAPLWSGTFRKPIHAPLTASFGATRLFNGQVTSTHRGTDFPAKTGTPVTASNAGEVILARKLFFEGNCVIIDHGQQFLTIYMHLSKIAVSEGEKVTTGQRIGLSGATGRASGPHLHMAVRWQGASLDPATLLALPLPATHLAQPATHRLAAKRSRSHAKGITN